MSKNNSTSTKEVNEFKIEDGKLCDSNASGIQPLCNFVAEITQDISVIDIDGVITHSYRISGINCLGVVLPTVEVRAVDFEKMDWPENSWGLDADIENLRGIKSKLAKAIKMNSKNVQKFSVYGFSGFVKIEEELGYVTTSGCIFADRFDTSIKAYVPGALVQYSVSNDYGGDFDLKENILEILHKTDCYKNNKSVSVVIKGFIFRSVLSYLNPLELSLFMVGGTGAYKTTAAMNFQSFFGRGFCDSGAPATFNDTGMAIESKRKSIQHGIMVADDFVTTVENKKNEDAAKADTFFRGVASKTSRDRCSANGQLIQTQYGGASILATGEHVPEGVLQSLNERITFLAIERSDVDIETLTRMSENAKAGDFEVLMFYFIQYIIKHEDKIKEEINKKSNNFRDRLKKDTNNTFHPRRYNNAASLLVGLYYFVRFALHHKVIHKKQANKIFREYLELIGQVMLEQERILNSNSAHTQLCDFILKGLKTNKFHLETYQKVENKCETDSLCIGWYDEKKSAVYIKSEAAVLNKMCKSVPENLKKILLVNSASFWRSILQENGLVKTDPNKTTIRRKPVLNGDSQRVYYLDIELDSAL
ncbi:hypothetical protein QLH52_04130 [Methylomonas sp. OY6]|uniref:DUF927 domain-containing protein n=1 Tax=Methylomonas defluvii TaxID=3045149 RepID=A0ABU4UAL5_9GAMM|nr:hypothetical protein [Methylomonas sp. OY6]MDX8126456.1 hypothetical protein [Methylomonas sp. OY6]